MPYINEPKRIPVIIRFFIWIAEWVTGSRLVPARLLSWYPKAAFSSAVMEALVAHKAEGIPHRLLQLVRMQVSFSSSCPFCIDMNSSGFSREGISPEEIEALQGSRDIGSVPTFTDKEKAALRFARAATSTPLSFDADTIDAMKRQFNDRQYVIIVSTIAQVNYWTRLIQSLGVPPAGFTPDSGLLKLDMYVTLKK